MDPILLNAVLVAVPDVADDTAGTAVVSSVADIAGAAADTAVAAAGVATNVGSAGNLYRRACRVTTIAAFTSLARPLWPPLLA